jgi:hypothetical protein
MSVAPLGGGGGEIPSKRDFKHLHAYSWLITLIMYIVNNTLLPSLTGHVLRSLTVSMLGEKDCVSYHFIYTTTHSVSKGIH